MADIFEVELSNGEKHYTLLTLPATDYQLLYALERLHTDANAQPEWEICKHNGFEYLHVFVTNECSIYELNALARNLDSMDRSDLAAFEGLFKTALARREGPMNMADIMSYANSTYCCHVVEGIKTDAELGRFYAENGFQPELEELPDSVFEKLDFAKIGKEMREAENGIFSRGCYVVQHETPKPVMAMEECYPKQPDYTVLLEVYGWSDGDPLDEPAAVRLKLPADGNQMIRVLETLEAASWDEVSFRCLDCRAPRLTEHIDDSTNIAAVNELAKRLYDMTNEQVTTYKALLEATDCDDVRMAALLTDTLNTYIFSPNLTCETDVARGELRLMLDGSAEELLRPFVDLHRYGKALIEQQNLSLTSYGVIERRDGQQIMSATNELKIRKGENDMNDIQRAMQMAQYYKDHYPPGTRIMLDSMENDPRPIEPGTKGTVKYVDDIGTLHCEFDNGRQLGICPGEDSFHTIHDEEMVEELSEQEQGMGGMTM